MRHRGGELERHKHYVLYGQFPCSCPSACKGGPIQLRTEVRHGTLVRSP
jgi:hypothetical protein